MAGLAPRTPCREVVGLVRAEACAWPSAVPKNRRPRGVKGLGLRYERLLAKRVQVVFPGALHGQWFRFWDANGQGLAQPDVVVVGENAVVVLEVKLTDTEGARRQLERLYYPVLRYVYRKPVFGVVVVKYLTRTSAVELVCGSLGEAIRRADEGIPTLHWLGRGRL